MDDDVQRSEGGRSAAKRALRGAARPFVGYFNQRFEDVHTHLDNPAAVQHLEAVMHGRFEHLLRELRDVRTEVAADADTIAELAFTLERFADLFTARMEEVAAQMTAARTLPHLDSTIVELPFAYDAARALAPGATVATIGDDGTLASGLAVSGLQVTSLEPATTIVQANVAVVAGPVADWGGPPEPLDAVFALSGAKHAGNPRATREHLDLFRKWLGPSGVLVLATRVGQDEDMEGNDVTDLLADWRIDRRTGLERDAGGGWRSSDETVRNGIVLVRATPRP
jgi:hypothetical protein